MAAMKLEEFVKEIHNEGEKFLAYWRKGMKKKLKGEETDDFPAVLDELQWWEQFGSWLQFGPPED